MPVAQLLDESKIQTNVHVVRATDQLIARLMLAQDINGNAFFVQGRRSRTQHENIQLSNCPMFLFRIIDVAPGEVSRQNGVVNRVSMIVECLVTPIFAVPGRSDADAQAVGQGIQDAMWRTIELYRDNNSVAPNLNGWQRTAPIFWDFTTDTNFKAKLAKGVTLWDPETTLHDPLLASPIQFKIEVYPQRPLTTLP